LIKQYAEKIHSGKVIYEPDNKVMDEFCYEGIVKKIGEILNNIVMKK